MIKTTGAEWNKFYNDPKIWGDGAWHEDETMVIDDIPIDDDTNLEKLPDSSIIKLSGGVVFHPAKEDGQSLESLFKKWRKSQSVSVFLVEVASTDTDKIKEIIKKEGGKKVI